MYDNPLLMKDISIPLDAFDFFATYDSLVANFKFYNLRLG